MLLMQGNVAFDAQARDRPEREEACNELTNGMSAVSKVSDLPALSKIKTTVRKGFADSKARCGTESSPTCSESKFFIAASKRRTGTSPKPKFRHRARLLAGSLCFGPVAVICFAS